MRLTPDDFPLRAMGTLIYSRNWSSPVLTACTPEVANLTVSMMNNMSETMTKLSSGEPVLVTWREGMAI